MRELTEICLQQEPHRILPAKGPKGGTTKAPKPTKEALDPCVVFTNAHELEPWPLRALEEARNTEPKTGGREEPASSQKKSQPAQKGCRKKHAKSMWTKASANANTIAHTATGDITTATSCRVS
jgi:hypothetical protein